MIHIFKEIENKDSNINKLIGDTYKNLQLHEILNYFKYKNNILWKVGNARGGLTYNPCILWADKQELIDDPYIGIDQIVGHTHGSCISISKVNEEDTLYFIDAAKNDKCSYFNLNYGRF
jgi:hypothetical protein